MPRYHVNPRTGKTGPCTAKVACRFGGEELHSDNEADALRRYEHYVENDNDPTTNLLPPAHSSRKENLWPAPDSFATEEEWARSASAKLKSQGWTLSDLESALSKDSSLSESQSAELYHGLNVLARDAGKWFDRTDPKWPVLQRMGYKLQDKFSDGLSSVAKVTRESAAADNETLDVAGVKVDPLAVGLTGPRNAFAGALVSKALTDR